MTMIHLDLFSGIGGFSRAVDAVWDNAEHIFCEIDPYCRALLNKRYEGSVIYGDIRELNLERFVADLRSRNTREGDESPQGGCQCSLERGETNCTSADCGCGDSSIVQPLRIQDIRGDENGELTKEQFIADTNSRGQAEQKLKTAGDKQCGRVDILTGGFPCQPFSQAGKRKGTDDNRYLWSEMLRVIREFQPTWVIAENVRGILSIEGGMVFEQVCLDLEGEGYEVQPFVIPAVAKDAPHRRDRVWFVAYRNNTGGTTYPDGTDRDGEKEDEGRKELPLSRVDGQDSHAPDTDSQGLQGVEETGDISSSGEATEQRPREQAEVNASNAECGRPYNKKDKQELEGEGGGELCVEQSRDNAGWERCWIEVAAELCGIYDEFPLWVDGYFKRLIGKEFYGTSNDKDRAKDLRILREAIQSEKIWEKIRGLFEMDDKEVLLKVLCRIEEVSNSQVELQCSGKESEKEMWVRELWKNAYFMRSPHRRKHQEQCARELTGIVSELPYETALEVAKTWDCLSCCYSSLTSPPAELDGLKLSKSRHRVERLKALGNAIVPQVAVEIMRGIKEANNE